MSSYERLYNEKGLFRKERRDSFIIFTSITQIRRILMGMGVILLLVFGLFAVIFLIVGYRLPSERIARSEMVVSCPVDKVYSYLAHIQNWPDWRLMPEILRGMSISYSGNDEETGAMVLWRSDVEGGSIEFLEMMPDKSIAYRFSLGKKKGMMDCTLELNPDGKQTRIVSKAVLSGGTAPSTRILAWMMESVVRKDLDSSLLRLNSQLSKS